MGRSINEFKSSFTKELARPSRFDVTLTPPFALAFATNVNARTLSYRCETTQLPGRTFATADRKTYGPIEKVPYITTYEDIELTFLVDDLMNEKYFFDAWLELVNPTATNDFNYKSEYATSILINQYDMQNNKIYAAELIDAFPVSINQMDLDWSSADVHKLTVTFAYTRWTNNSLANYIF